MSVDQPVLAADLAAYLNGLDNTVPLTVADNINEFLHANDYRIFTETQVDDAIDHVVLAASLAPLLANAISRPDMESNITTFLASYYVYAMIQPVDPYLAQQTLDQIKLKTPLKLSTTEIAGLATESLVIGDTVSNTTTNLLVKWNGSAWIQEIVTRDSDGKVAFSSAVTTSIKINSRAIYVASLADLPTAVAGVITLADNANYFITSHLDLLGSRIVCGLNNSIDGLNATSSSLTSTSLNASTPLITTTSQINLRDITIKNVGTALSINAPNSVLDWSGVRFLNVPTIGSIANVALFGFGRGGLNLSKGLTFEGKCTAIAFVHTAFVSSAAAGSMITLGSTLIMGNRFRFVDCGFTVNGLATGVTIDPSAVINTEAFMLDSVAFSGAGTYMSGVSATSQPALFLNCAGISNSSNGGELVISNNATVTTFANTTSFFKIAGTNTTSSATKYTATDNRLTNASAVTRKYLVTGIVSFTGTALSTIRIGMYNSATSSVVKSQSITLGLDGKATNVLVMAVVEHMAGNYVELHARNTSNTLSITVTDLELTLSQL